MPTICNTSSPNAPCARTSARVLLVDDQPIIAQAVRKMLEGEDGFVFEYCQNAREALGVAASFKPTVILQDLVMPDVDGFTLVKFFRGSPDTADVPIVVLSSAEDAEVKFRAFQCGANDYMVKFPHPLEVIARIRYHSDGFTARRLRNEAVAKLEASQRELKKQLAEADKYVQSLLPQKLDTPDLKTDWIFKSSSELGGDCFGCGWLDGDNFAIYLLDVCGHGVGAALLSVSAMNVLRSQSLAGVDFRSPKQVLEKLNNAFLMENQNGMYFTLWYGVWRKSAHTITFASGGHPPAIIVKPDGSCVKLGTNGMVIGGMEDMRFAENSAPLESGDKLFVFSDGVYEVSYADDPGRVMSFSEFASELAKPALEGASKVRSMMIFSRNAQRREQFEDDFSLFEVDIK